MTTQADLTQYNIAVFRRKHYIYIFCAIHYSQQETDGPKETVQKDESAM